MSRSGKVGKSRLHQAWYYFSGSIRATLHFPDPVPDNRFHTELERLAGLYKNLRRGHDNRETPDRPAVSVVIPVHFAEPREKIMRTLETLLENRNAPATELVVVVNGKATTPQLLECEPYRIFQTLGARVLTISYLEDERYTNIVRPAYIFVPKQRGLDAAEGEIVLGTDVDNIFSEHWIRDYKNAFDDDPDMLMAYGPVQLYGSTGIIGKTQILISTLVKASKIFIDFPPYAGHNHAMRTRVRILAPDLYNQIVVDCHETPGILARHIGLTDPLTSRVRCLPDPVISTYFPKQTESLRLAIKWFWIAAKRNIDNWRRVQSHRDRAHRSPDADDTKR